MLVWLVFVVVGVGLLVGVVVVLLDLVVDRLMVEFGCGLIEGVVMRILLLLLLLLLVC